MKSKRSSGLRRNSQRQRKYRPEIMLPALRLFIAARNKAVESGFTDNGGAIHSVERILDMLSVQVCYPHLSHINNLKKHPDAEISVAAYKARQSGEAVFIEHVLPQRAYARRVIDLINRGAENDAVLAFIKRNYRLVLLTKEEVSRLNKQNRSRITTDRIAEAGIELRRHRND